MIRFVFPGTKNHLKLENHLHGVDDFLPKTGGLHFGFNDDIALKEAYSIK